MQLRLRSLLLPIGPAYDGGCRHGGDYRGVEKGIFLWVRLRRGEYCAKLDVVFWEYGGRMLGEPKPLLFRM